MCLWLGDLKLDVDESNATKTATHNNVNIRISFKDEYAYSVEEVVDYGWSNYLINFQYSKKLKKQIAIQFIFKKKQHLNIIFYKYQMNIFI